MNAVRCYINGRQDRWDECLPQIASALRASVNRSTGFTPNRLMLGREVNTPLNLMYPQGATNSPGGTCDDYVTKLEADIQQAHIQARETLKVSQKRMKKDYDIKARRYTYKQGDAVYILDKASIKGRSDKLRSPWKGPGLVKAVLTPYLVEVQLRGRSMVLNHDSLKPCRDGTLPVWLSKARGKLGEQPVFCKCHQPARGDMVQCGVCLEWFHCDCVGMTLSEARVLPEYLCTECRDGK